ncbi:MAG: hypothetical protein AABY22_36315, partial [Nanoarchaeota archaeon]
MEICNPFNVIYDIEDKVILCCPEEQCKSMEIYIHGSVLTSINLLGEVLEVSDELSVEEENLNTKINWDCYSEDCWNKSPDR